MEDRTPPVVKPRRVKVPHRLWKAIGEVELAGLKMSNVCYNLAQHSSLDADTRKIIDECRKEWDAASRALSALL
jgi:hypothetical protein